MNIKSKYKRVLGSICAAVMLIAALSVCAFAADTSIEDQMAANSAAWYVAKAAGDTATCEALHAANVALANQAAGTTGTANYNSASGTWDITTSSGSKISSSGTSDGKQSTITYSTTTTSGSTSSTSASTYSSTSISAYKANGGTNEGLQTAYNNDAARVSTTGNYGSVNAVNSASAEVAVVKELLGLSDAEAAKLQSDLESAKQEYLDADEAYKEAVASGDAAAIAEAKAARDTAHDAAEAVRAEYNYTGDAADYDDGGYYSGWNSGTPTTGGTSGTSSGSFIIPITSSDFTIKAISSTGGTISPNGVVSIKRGRSQNFVMTAKEGYTLKSVIVDGTDKGAISSYTFSKVRSSHTIRAEFVKQTFTITSSCDRNGTISPKGKISVGYGEDQTFTFTPNKGYVVSKVMVDGKSIGAVDSYTFTNVVKAHTISVSFKAAEGKISIDDVDVTDALGADLSGNSIKSGYGIFAKVSGSYENVTNPKMVMTYNFGDGKKTVTLQETSAGVFEFPKNSTSPTKQRCVYIPVATKDGSYTLTMTFTATKANGTTVTETRTATVKVLGSMYEDDFTGDS